MRIFQTDQKLKQNIIFLVGVVLYYIMIILAGLPVADVRSRVAFRIWVSAWSPFGIPADFLWGLTFANRLLGTSSPAASFWSCVVVFCSGVAFGSLVARIIFKLFEGRYWQCGRRILNILFVMCFYQFFTSFTCKLLPCFAMDG